MSSKLQELLGNAAPIRDGNPEPRIWVELVADNSGSMIGEKIRQLNAGLHTFGPALRDDPVAASRVVVDLITFGGDVQVVQDSVPVSKFNPPELSAGGDTPLGAALLEAMDRVDHHEARCEASDLDRYRPRVILLTDGIPTDSPEVLERARQRIRGAKNIEFYAIGVEGADMDFLKRLSKRSPRKLQGLKFIELFRWLSQSLIQVSRSRVGEDVPLPSTDD